MLFKVKETKRCYKSGWGLSYITEKRIEVETMEDVIDLVKEMLMKPNHKEVTIERYNPIDIEYLKQNHCID